jgi:non-specific serine/threonine protein kinase
MKDALGRTAYVRKGPQLGDMLPLLRHCLTFIGGGASTLKDVVTVMPERVSSGIRVEKSEAGLRLIPRLAVPDELLPPETPLTIICENPSWILGGSTLFELAESSPAVDMLMEAAPDFVTIPPDDAELFYRDYLPRLTERAPVDVQNVTWIEIDADPVARIYLEEAFTPSLSRGGCQGEAHGELRIRLKFAYDGHEVGVDIPSTGVSVVKSQAAGATTLARIHRKREREEAQWSNLLQHGLKAGGVDRDIFTLRARVEPLDFLVHYIPQLLEAGFEVYGQDELKSIRVNRNRPKLEFFVSSGIDWFDVNASAKFGDIELPLSGLYEAIRKRERFVKLADGSIGAIPPEWLERYRHLFALGEKSENAIRVSARQQLLIEDALSQADQAEVDADYQERRDRLRGFENIAPHPLPVGFVGELRPYQKAGYDWLHFLREYGFGGCLADDMGIGKTVQTLAFLLSLKEAQHLPPLSRVGGQGEGLTSLIVMPRSLLFNWEREAAKFTPGLKVLVHAENRTKKAMHFERYDLVLTTYGILLRDIDMLRKYRFHYAILDESQAIKNPLSQTGRAARLLNSDHRLTPPRSSEGKTPNRRSF